MVKATRLGEITLNKSSSSRLGVCHEASSLTQENYLAKKKLNGEMLEGSDGHCKIADFGLSKL